MHAIMCPTSVAKKGRIRTCRTIAFDAGLLLVGGKVTGVQTGKILIGILMPKVPSSRVLELRRLVLGAM